MGNADMSTNFFTHVDANIHKGDIVVQNGERYYMLNWVEQEQINSISTQMLECNTSLEIKRYFDEELDENAYLIEEAGYKTVVDAIPANFAKYAGRPDFTSLDGVPGVHADQLISGMVQYNSKTKLMKIGDMFEMDGEVYRIINFHLFEVNYTKTNGVINIEAKKAAGGWGKA